MVPSLSINDLSPGAGSRAEAVLLMATAAVPQQLMVPALSTTFAPIGGKVVEKI